MPAQDLLSFPTPAEAGWVLDSTTLNGRLAELVSPRLAHRHRVLPVAVEIEEQGSGRQRLILAALDPSDLQAHAAIGRSVQCDVRWVSSSEEELREGLELVYGVGAESFDEIIGDAGEQVDGLDGSSVTHLDDDEEGALIGFVNQILRDALGRRATDIHIEPLEADLRIRYRVDGVLQNATVPSNIQALKAQLLSRLKVMASLDLAERRRPQDGRISLTLDGEPIDVRVATIPSVEGESISLRLLSRQKYSLDRLGFSSGIRARVDRLLAEPNGIVLVTGPTGSGKSTTLYGFLASLNSEDRRIITVEDPVEHKLPGVVQIAVKAEIGLSFANGLRSILRGDPNVIMVGEIRDTETAKIAIRSAQTGHLVFSTLHTNDAIGGITRLLDMGIEPYLIASSVRAFFAQRLVRTLCHSCRRRVPVPAGLENELPPEISEVWEVGEDSGCKKCRGTGYLGRMAIYELCEVTPELAEMVVSGASSRSLQEHAVANGYRPMRSYGWEKVALGDTTVSEVLYATAAD